MIKTILVAASGNGSDAATLAAALAIARPFGAHLDVLHVRFDPVSAALAMATDAGSGAMTAGLIEQLERDADARAAQARDGFDRFCAAAGLQTAGAPATGGAGSVTAQFHIETGEEPRWIATYGLAADLIVGSRGADDASLARSTLEAALLDTGRPLLIPAAAAVSASIDRIAVAWKPTPQAARAVALALPFLMRTREIVLLTVPEQAEAPDDADRLLRNLRWHGFTARFERLSLGPDGAAATLLAAAQQRADLLVMGGYGHSRLREWVFGGFTQQVLVAAPLPVLIAH